MWVALQEPHHPASSYCYIFNMSHRRGHCWWWCPGTCWHFLFPVFAHGKSWMSRLCLLGIMWMILHLLGLKSICQVCSRSPRESRSWSRACSCWSLILLYTTLTSAKSVTLECWTALGESLIYNIKERRGPRTVPWGTPDRTAAEDDSEPSSATCCIMPARKDYPAQGLIGYFIVW